jgi:TfoX/Sxy family transcriptional regulator of competence genes
MSTTKDFAQYVLDQIDSPLTRVRGMFGEFALYYDERVVAFICDNAVFMKMTPNTTRLLESVSGKGEAYPGSKDYYVISEEQLEDFKFFTKVVEACAEDVPRKKKK